MYGHIIRQHGYLCKLNFDINLFADNIVFICNLINLILKHFWTQQFTILYNTTIPVYYSHADLFLDKIMFSCDIRHIICSFFFYRKLIYLHFYNKYITHSI